MSLQSLWKLVTGWRPPLALSLKDEHLFELDSHLYYLFQQHICTSKPAVACATVQPANNGSHHGSCDASPVMWGRGIGEKV